MASTYPTSLDSFATNRANGQVIQASTDNDQADAINRIEAELGTDPSGASATVKARLDSVESTRVFDARTEGVLADGAALDSDAWVDLAAALPDGAAVTWVGNSRIEADALALIGRLNLIGQGQRSAFTIVGSDDTVDGLVVGGADGPRYGHTLRDFCILGAAGCCRRALVLLNLVDPVVDNVWVKAGAADFGVSIEGVQNAEHVYIRCSNNMDLPYAGTAPESGFRIVGSALLPTNANKLRLRAEALTGDGIVGDATVGTAGSFNNYLSGVAQGCGGRGVDLKGFTDGTVSHFHSEANSGDDLRLEDCQRGHVGPGVFVDGHTSLVDCDDMKLDGITSVSTTIDVDCNYTEIGRAKLDNGGAFTDNSLTTFWTGSPFIGYTGDITPSILDGGNAQGGMTVTGARVGMRVQVAYTQAVPQGVSLDAEVAANNDVKWIFRNNSGGTWNATTGKVRATVFRS